ncbi:MAG: hypothetical protein ACOZIN_09040 [Myxococcota bacterium]
MARIAKTAVNRALEHAGELLVKAGGKDGRISRTEAKKAVEKLNGGEKKLVDVFFRFIDHRDHKKGAQVTAQDVQKAVTYARKHMVESYDLDKNGLSASEVKKMSLSGKLAVELAKSLKLAGVGAGPKNGEVFADFLERMTTESEKTFTGASQVRSSLLEKQIIAAALASEYEVSTLAEVFASVDEGQIEVRQLKDPASGEKFVAIDFGAGGNTYGAVFRAGQTKPVAAVHDSDLYVS